MSKTALQDQYIHDKILWLLSQMDIIPQRIENYILAFVHRSIVNERPDYTPEHNERLEFLGDAVLELVVTNSLYHDFPEKPEGELTDMRSAIVRGRNLAQVARKLDFMKYLLLWKGEEKWGGRENDYILANTLEAFIWAVYLDQGIEKAQDFILQNIYSSLGKITTLNLFKDFKTLLQEFTQAEFDTTPHYRLISESGPDHDKHFQMWVYLGEKQIWEGEGSSKKKSQEDAAKNAYLLLNPA